MAIVYPTKINLHNGHTLTNTQKAIVPGRPCFFSEKSVAMSIKRGIESYAVIL